MEIKDVDGKIGAKGRGGVGGKPTKSISMATPGEGKISKPRGSMSVRSAAHDADAQQFTGGQATEHPYDSSTNFGGAGGGGMSDED